MLRERLAPDALVARVDAVEGLAAHVGLLGAAERVGDDDVDVVVVPASSAGKLYTPVL